MDLGLGWGTGWDRERAILLRQRIRGAGLCSRIPSFSLGGGGLGTRIGVCSPPCFLLLSAYPTSPPGPLGGPQAQLPYLGAFSPARSHHAPSGSQAPSLPPGALWGPHVSPSTSALSLVLSHGNRRKESQRALAGPHRMPTKALGGGGGSGLALPSPESEAGHAQWGLGPILHRRSQEAEAQAPARLRARDWLGAGVGHAPLLFSRCCRF